MTVFQVHFQGCTGTAPRGLVAARGGLVSAGAHTRGGLVTARGGLDSAGACRNTPMVIWLAHSLDVETFWIAPKRFHVGTYPKRFHVDAFQNVSTSAHRGHTSKTFPVSTCAHRGTWKRFLLSTISHVETFWRCGNVLKSAAPSKRLGSSKTFPRGGGVLGVTAA